MSPEKSRSLIALVFGLCILLGGRANAGVLRFESEVTVVSGSSVGTGIFATDTSVKFSGLFDSTDYLLSGSDALYRFSSLTIDIVGVGTFEAADPSDFGVFAGEESFFGNPAIGISSMTVTGEGYLSTYASTTNPFDYSTLAPNEFSGWDSTPLVDVLTIALAGGAGDFTFTVSDVDPTSASITPLSAPVPEPNTMAIMGIGSLLVMVRRARRARRSAELAA
jgi:hypothetical protein